MGESLTSFFIGTLKAILLTAICFHLFHFAEETVYEFHKLFPQLLGLAPWPVSIFVGFNFAWVIIWLIGIFLVSPNRVTVTTFWFLAIASAINGIAHPVFSILVGGYFPGLVSSPFVGVLGILLVRNLYQASSNAKTATITA